MKRFVVSRILLMTAAMVYPWLFWRFRITPDPAQLPLYMGAVFLGMLMLVGAAALVGRSDEAAKIRKDHYMLIGLPVGGSFALFPTVALAGVHPFWIIAALDVLILLAFAGCTRTDIRKYRKAPASA